MIVGLLLIGEYIRGYSYIFRSLVVACDLWMVAFIRNETDERVGVCFSHQAGKQTR